MRVGAIDIGSNSIRLLVADVGVPPESGVITVARAGEVCRLGRGLHRSGLVDETLATRAGVIAAEFARRARSLGALHVIAGATAALRDAGNGPAVARTIEQACGLPVRILSGDDEAQLVYRSVVQALGGAAVRSSCVVFDLGGGSTEVVSGVGERAGRWVSLPVGAVSLTERYINSDPPLADEIARVEQEVRAAIMHGCASMPAGTPLFAGVGGTVTVLASLDRQLESYEPGLIEGWSIPPDRLKAMVQRILSLTEEGRLASPVMGSGRADIVAAGAIVVLLLAERFPSGALVCSTQGLRYGLVRMAADELAVRPRNHQIL
jgi:exopolyphosphatase / guanosine-5'-triphosphate,3'-diphosphate pyrophosphatase